MSTALSEPARISIKRLLIALVLGNTLVFLTLALTGRISNAPDTLVFVDFWGRLTVYSFWFAAYAAYRIWFEKLPVLRALIVAAVLFNIPFFLTLGYLGKLPTDANSAVMIDFWGRLTVYSLWFIAYETYRKYIENPAQPTETT